MDEDEIPTQTHAEWRHPWQLAAVVAVCAAAEIALVVWWIRR